MTLTIIILLNYNGQSASKVRLAPEDRKLEMKELGRYSISLTY